MSLTPPLVAVYTTVATPEDARGLARAMVETKLCACAQISAIESFYTWDGATQQEPEWRVLFKTAACNYPALEAAIRGRHPYQLPAIYSLAVDAASGPYAEWVARESDPGAAASSGA